MSSFDGGLSRREVLKLGGAVLGALTMTPMTGAIVDKLMNWEFAAQNLTAL